MFPFKSTLFSPIFTLALVLLVSSIALSAPIPVRRSRNMVIASRQDEDHRHWHNHDGWQSQPDPSSSADPSLETSPGNDSTSSGNQGIPSDGDSTPAPSATSSALDSTSTGDSSGNNTPSDTDSTPTPTASDSDSTTTPTPTSSDSDSTSTTSADAPSGSDTPSGTDSSSPATETSGTHSGQGTFYTTGLGACGITNSATDLIAAMGYQGFDGYPGATANPNDNPICNKKVTATYQGKTVTVAITDRCAGCAGAYDLDFSRSAFDQLADESVGRIDLTWVWAE